MEYEKAQTSVPIRQKLKELLKHGVVFGLTSSLQSLLAFILLPVLTAYYTPSLFGVYSLVLVINAFGSSFFYFGASSALGRFYYDFESPDARKKIVSTALIITFIGAFTLIGLSLFIAPFLSRWLFESEIYSVPIILGLSGAAIGFLMNTMTLVLRYDKKSIAFLVISIVIFLLNFGITYTLLVKFNSGIYAPLYGTLISNTLALIILLLFYIRSITFDLELKHFYLLFNFGIQISIISLLFYIYQWIDQFIINDILNLKEVGIYSLGFKMGSLLNVIFILPFSLIWAPIRMQYSKNENADLFLTKIISYYSVIGITIILLLTIFADLIIEILFRNPIYSNAAQIFPLIMIAFLFSGYQNILDYGIYLYKKIYYYILIALLSILLKVLLNYLFIPRFGITAAAYITIFVYFISSTAIYFASNKFYKIRIEFKRVFYPLAFLFISFFLINLEFYNLYLKFLIIGFIFCFGIYLIFKFWLYGNEQNYLMKITNKIFKRSTF